MGWLVAGILVLYISRHHIYRLIKRYIKEIIKDIVSDKDKE